MTAKLVKLLAGIITLGATTLWSHDMVPATQPEQKLLIQNATLHTVSRGVKEHYDILITDGKISAMADSLSADESTKIVDATGKHIYPGLIGLSTTLGLVEISAVRATRDFNETGRITPEVKAHIAFNADSELIPTVRSNGITHVEVAPSGNGLRGQSSVMQLDGWNWQDAVVKTSVGMHLTWPSVSINKSFWEKRSVKEQKEDNAKALKAIKETFEQIMAYHKARNNDKDQAIDLRWEAMRPVVSGEMPLFVHANDYRQIEQAIQFTKQNNLKLVIVGAFDAVKAIDLLKQHKTPVVFTHAWGRPGRSDEAVDIAYRTPATLEQNGVPYTLAIQGNWNVRDLPFAVGQSIAYGVSPSTALKSVTLEPAKILGLDKLMGSLDVGKQANLVISQGDLFDHLTHKIEAVYIEGREIDLNNRHKQLYQKYSNK